jgi:hypothetical protein
MTFCEQMINRMDEDKNFIDSLCLYDEAHFELSDVVNKQSCRYSSPQNPNELHEKPLQSERVTVWCSVSSQGVIGSFFFEDNEGKATTLTAARYVHMIETFLETN